MHKAFIKPCKLGVSFGESIKLAYNNYFTFSGRSSRSEYWWFQLYRFIVYTLLTIAGVFCGLSTLLMCLADTDMTPEIATGGGFAIMFLMLYALFALINFFPNLSLLIRRLHDSGRTGWWALLDFIPFVNSVGYIVTFVLTLIETEAYANEYGDVEGANYPIKPGLESLYGVDEEPVEESTSETAEE